MSQQLLQSLVILLVQTCLDYGNVTLTGLPSTQLNRLQLVMNAGAQLACSAQMLKHITPLLCNFHWLQVPQWTEFKLATFVFHSLHGTAPQYRHEDCAVWQTSTHDVSNYIQHRDQCLSFHRLVASPLVTMPSMLLALVCGTACHPTLLHRRYSPASSNDWKCCRLNVHYTAMSDCMTLS